jgi:DNA polymerase V
MPSIALVDCNNFFISCERLFNPKLHHRPAVVLSSNDGCIIARSQEVKAMGVPMGAPYFQWVDFLKARKVFICSSNFSLYADLSHRVMQTLSHFNAEIEIYSIDEAFLLLDPSEDPIPHCRMIRQKVLQWVGIPVSIGIATTKTLAKVANRVAKNRESMQGVCAPSPDEFNSILNTLDVGEIWGIGRRLKQFLAKQGIFTAGQLRDQPDLWVKNALSVTGLRTVWELRGIPCLQIEEQAPAKQTIMTSRSFGRPIVTQEELLEAICSFGARGAEKLRQEERLANWMQVFIMTKGEYDNYAHITLPHPTDFTPTLLNYATQGLKAIFRTGFSYKKGGILLGGLVPKTHYQQDLFFQQSRLEEGKRKDLMTLLDQINEQFGSHTLRFAAEGTLQPWQRKRQMCSPCFTTQWFDLLTIQI